MEENRRKRGRIMQTVSVGWDIEPIVTSNEVVSVDVIKKVTFHQRHDKGENQLCSYPEHAHSRHREQPVSQLKAGVYLA